MRELWRTRRAVTIMVSVLVSAVVIAVLVWLWRVSAPGATGDQLGTFATTVSAVAAAGAALASWRSAARSDVTARRAAEAVGMSIQPDVRADFIGRVTIGGKGEVSRIDIRNHSIWPAANVHVLYDSGEGWTRTASLGSLAAGQLPAGEGYPDRPAIRTVELPLTPRQWIPSAEPDWEGKRRIVETTTVDFEDERGFVQWRRIEKYERIYEGRSAGGGGMVSTTLEKAS